jgi:hypothetical protein
MGKFPQKMCLFFWAYFIRIEKRSNFVEDFFSIPAPFRRERNLKIQKLQSFFFLERKRIVLLRKNYFFFLENLLIEELFEKVDPEELEGWKN